jgi:alpha-beta hydrolase superfamily lysophospholipase
MSATEAFPTGVRFAPRHVLPILAVLLAVPILFWGVSFCLAGAAEKPSDQKDKLPEPEEKVLMTSDGVKLVATYYPGTKGKDTVPVVLLHMYKQSRSDYAEFAVTLQKLGHAVLAPDLRAHGGSTERRGTQVPLKAENLSRLDFTRMVTCDMEAVKDFLREENNKEKLSIEKLCLVGAEMGASVALTWTQLDWSRAPVGIYKLGQDVKALVLISPEWSTPGLPLKAVLTNSNTRFRLTDPVLISAAKKGVIRFRNAYDLDMRSEVSVLIVAGKGDSAAVQDAERLHAMLKRYHEPPLGDDQQDLYYGTLDTKLQGTKMLGKSGLNLEGLISEFIRRRLVEQGYPWQKRLKDPHASPG